MKYVRITVDGITYNLVKMEDGTWVITTRAPQSAGDYLITVTLTTEAGQEIVVDTDDEDLLQALTLLVREGDTVSGDRMRKYYPKVISDIQEFKAIVRAEGFEVDFLKSELSIVVDDAYLTTMSEERIKEWEKLLSLTITSDETIEDRREKIIAIIRGSGKLNTSTINSIVGSFTNGATAKSYIEDSVLYVKIFPPEGNKQYKFTNVENALRNKVPAHLGLVVTRNYATWGEISNNFASWKAVAQSDNWETIKLYVAP